MTQTFSSSERIAIPDSADTDGGGEQGSPANPYPATIEVSGFTNGVITSVRVHLNDLSHTNPSDITILLAAPHLRVSTLIMRKVADVTNGATDVNLVLDDAAPTNLPTLTALKSGTFRPTVLGVAPLPAPAPSGNTVLGAFQGRNPNGTWQLFISDEAYLDTGSLGGWALEISAEVDLPASTSDSSRTVTGKRVQRDKSEAQDEGRSPHQQRHHAAAHRAGHQ